jgi:hypothetical protein
VSWLIRQAGTCNSRSVRAQHDILFATSYLLSGVHCVIPVDITVFLPTMQNQAGLLPGTASGCCIQDLKGSTAWHVVAMRLACSLNDSVCKAVHV